MARISAHTTPSMEYSTLCGFLRRRCTLPPGPYSGSALSFRFFLPAFSFFFITAMRSLAMCFVRLPAAAPFHLYEGSMINFSCCFLQIREYMPKKSAPTKGRFPMMRSECFENIDGAQIAERWIFDFDIFDFLFRDLTGRKTLRFPRPVAQAHFSVERASYKKPCACSGCNADDPSCIVHF